MHGVRAADQAVIIPSPPRQLLPLRKVQIYRNLHKYVENAQNEIEQQSWNDQRQENRSRRSVPWLLANHRFYLNFKVVSANSANISDAIQNLTMIFDSDQPINSK